MRLDLSVSRYRAVLFVFGNCISETETISNNVCELVNGDNPSDNTETEEANSNNIGAQNNELHVIVFQEV